MNGHTFNLSSTLLQFLLIWVKLSEKSRISSGSDLSAARAACYCLNMGTADKNDQKRYYVYLFRHPDDGRPVYVGKGTGERAKSHRTDSPNVFLFDLLKEFPEIEPEFVQVDLTESEAFALEKCLIAQYGRQIDGSGTLFNVLEGGADEYGRGQNLEFEGVNYSSLKALCLARGVDYHKVYLRINR